MISIDGEFAMLISVYMDLKLILCIMIVFKVYLSMIGIDESEELCWKKL